MEKSDKTKGSAKDTEVEKLADGVILMANDKEILIAVSEETANTALSDAARSNLYCEEKNGHTVYSGAATAIPLYELSKTNPSIREYIISEESLRATLCDNFPEYVKTYNTTVPSEEQIKNADAPPNLFLQKQLDQEADKTRLEVAEFQLEQSATQDETFEDILELER